MRLLFKIIYFFFLVNSVYSNQFISEINFLDNEYLEIYSNQTLNLSNSLLFDTAGINKSNTLELYSKKNSSLYLIVGDDFLETYNISNLNCSIYKSGKSNLGYRNLKNTGENLSLLVNSSLNFTFIKLQDYNFNTNQTLNYNYYNDSYYLSNNSICELPKLKIIINQPNYGFEIIFENSIIFEKLKYKFKTNATNFTIEYWITDYQNNILKSKRNTTNTNTKTFTPKLNSSDILIIHSNLYINSNITKYINQTIFYYKAPLIKNISNQSNNCYINIITYEDLFYQNKLEYRFKVPNKNFTIEYWIEDYQNITIKNKRNTTNTNKKSYSPKTFSEIFQIKANYYSDNCTTNTTKLVFFYKKYEEISCSEQTSTSRLTESKSYIIILNKDDLINQKTNILKYEIYKGDTNKRTIYIYENSKKLHSQELPKFTKIKGQIILNLEKEKNSIKLSGLDLEETFQITTNESNTKQLSEKEKLDFQISNISQKNIHINFKIGTLLKNLTGICYINFIRTKISNSINLTKTKSLIINQTKLLKKSTQKSYNLTLVCKYQKQNQKTINYASTKFLYYPITNIQTNNILQLYTITGTQNNKNTALSKSTNSIFNTLNLPNYLENPITINFTPKEEQKTLENYKSNNQILKENSFFAVFIGISILFLIFLVKW